MLTSKGKLELPKVPFLSRLLYSLSGCCLRRKKYKKCLGKVNVVVFVIDVVDVDDVAAAVSVSVFGVDDVDVDVPPAVVAVAVAVTKLFFFIFGRIFFPFIWSLPESSSFLLLLDTPLVTRPGPPLQCNRWRGGECSPCTFLCPWQRENAK